MKVQRDFVHLVSASFMFIFSLNLAAINTSKRYLSKKRCQSSDETQCIRVLEVSSSGSVKPTSIAA